MILSTQPGSVQELRTTKKKSHTKLLATVAFFSCIKVLLGRRTKTLNHFKCVEHQPYSWLNRLLNLCTHPNARTHMSSTEYPIQALECHIFSYSCTRHHTLSRFFLFTIAHQQELALLRCVRLLRVYTIRFFYRRLPLFSFDSISHSTVIIIKAAIYSEQRKRSTCVDVHFRYFFGCVKLFNFVRVSFISIQTVGGLRPDSERLLLFNKMWWTHFRNKFDKSAFSQLNFYQLHNAQQSTTLIHQIKMLIGV